MPYSGANDPDLPDNVKGLPENDRRQWVSIWNGSFDKCIMDGSSPDNCEGVAFRNANGVLFGEKVGMFDISSVDGLRFSINQVAEIERRVVDGVDYLVAPVVAIKAGVLNDELVPIEEISAHFSAWNGRPFVVGHPKNLDGTHISANHPPVLSSLQIGRLFNVHLDGDALKGEVWIDVDKARSVNRGKEVIDRLETGKPLEVSTAYFRNKVLEAGSIDGKEFVSRASGLRPDHLAALLDTAGACSWQDGCGTPRVNEGKETTQIDVSESESIEIQASESRAMGALKAIMRALGVNQEDKMDKLVAAIMEIGGLEASEEELRGLSETMLGSILKMMKKRAAAEPEAEVETEVETPPVDPSTNEGCPETSAKVLAFVEKVEQRGGLDALFAARDTLQANEDERKTELMATLAANASCAFSKEQLERLELDTLETLQKSLSPVDYSGQGGGRVSSTREQAYSLPSMWN